MTFTIVVFIASFLLAIGLTPLARRFGYAIGAMDLPGPRKHHASPKPRTGGLAIFISFVLASLLGIFLLDSKQAQNLLLSQEALGLVLGGTCCFIVGFLDDIRSLPALLKLGGQVFAAFIAFYFGIRIHLLPIAGTELPIWASFMITTFWFLLFVNATNLIDGLDGLAAGVSLFACLMLVLLSILRGQYHLAMIFGALAGSLLGFLRYNFIPSTIFMGDSGSYFIGFTIAGLAIFGSAKGQLGAAFLIPFITMGVPIFDTLTSPLRRFICGRNIFSADSGHIHHKLIFMGLTARRAVLFIYFITFILCIVSIIAVQIKDEIAGGILFLISTAMFLIYRTLAGGNISFSKILLWLKDIADVLGLSHDRRFFLDIQSRITHCKTTEELWPLICEMFEKYNLCYAEINLSEPYDISLDDKACFDKSANTMSLSWTNSEFDKEASMCSADMFKAELPLITNEGIYLGSLWIIKRAMFDHHEHKIFMRLEQLRRSLVAILPHICKNATRAGD